MDIISDESNKTGYNINNKIDICKVAGEFINFYYTNTSFTNNSSNRINNLYQINMIRDYTKFKYNGDELKDGQIINFLKMFKSSYRVNINKYDFIDNGSRRIDISLIGTAHHISNNEKFNFSQTFTICHQKGEDTWYIKNSIFFTF